MTTKPRHTTTRKRHGADVRHTQRQAQADQVERELREALASHYHASAATAAPRSDTTKSLAARTSRVNRGIVVRYSVRRRDGGLPFVFEYTAKPGTWRETAEHDAKMAINRAGLVAHAHLETLSPED